MGHAGAMRPNPIPGQMFGNFPPTDQGRRRQAGGVGGYEMGPSGQGQNPFAKSGPIGYDEQPSFVGYGQPKGGSPGGGYNEQPSFTGAGQNPGYLWGGGENPLFQPQSPAQNNAGPSASSLGMGSGGFGNRTMMGQASPGGWSNPLSGMNFPTPSSGMIGGALGGMVGGLPGAFLGNRAGNWLGERFGWGQGSANLTDSPSPFMPEWLGGSGESSLDGPGRFNMTAPENLMQFGPNGNPMSNMGTYRSGRGFATGSISPGDISTTGSNSAMGLFGTQAELGEMGRRMYSMRR